MSQNPKKRHSWDNYGIIDAGNPNNDGPFRASGSRALGIMNRATIERRGQHLRIRWMEERKYYSVTLTFKVLKVLAQQQARTTAVVRFIPSPNASPLQNHREGQRWAAWESWLAERDKTPAAAGTAEAAEFLTSRGRRAPKTLREYCRMCNRMYRLAGVASPFIGLKPKGPPRFVRRALEPNEVTQLLSILTGELRLLVLIGLYTGARLGDCVRLTWDCIRDNWISFRAHKTGASCRLPLHPVLAEALGPPGSGPVLPGLLSRYLHRPANVVRSIDGRIKRAGMTISFHYLRHTFISRLAEAGAPAAIIQAMVGHTTAAMTARYTHIGAETMKAALSQAQFEAARPSA